MSKKAFTAVADIVNGGKKNPEPAAPASASAPESEPIPASTPASASTDTQTSETTHTHTHNNEGADIVTIKPVRIKAGEQKTARMNLLFPPSLREKVFRAAKKSGLSVNEYIRQILEAQPEDPE